MLQHLPLLIPIVLFLSFFHSTVNCIALDSSTRLNPLSAKATALRYWSQKIPNNRPKPSFLLSKLSPLSPSHSAILQKLADQGVLSSHLSDFCIWAHLFCLPTDTLSTNGRGIRDDANFARYTRNQNFTDYGTSRPGGVDSFMNYSDGVNIPVDSFKRYNRDAFGRSESFANYAPDGNVASGEFTSYGISANSGASEFINYDRLVNSPNLKFSTYNSDGVGRPQTFTSYSDETNSGGQSFTSYGKRGTGLPSTFASYGKESNVMGSTFSGYGENGNGANDSFTSYGFNGNVPKNTFLSYGDGGNAAVESFSSYRDSANVGDDSFTSYGKSSNAGKATFGNYGNSVNGGTDTFKMYGKGGAGHVVGFKAYFGTNTTFKDYANKRAASFAQYMNTNTHQEHIMNDAAENHAKRKWVVEEGKFFRESALKQGSTMKMPDISDKMPARSFLPRSIARKIPFSSARMGELLGVFGADENSTVAGMVGRTLEECERAPSLGETKRCVASAEDMIDFAVEVLGRGDVTVKSTQGVGGSKQTVEIGRVGGIDGGRVTKSVSCHQSLFPYLVYFCHSVPKVRVYEVDIVELVGKKQINRGVAICHIDTSAWGPGHGAFQALGGGPGKIEVCHWIYENDMTWVMG